MKLKIAVAGALAIFIIIVSSILIANFATKHTSTTNSSKEKNSTSQTSFTKDEVAKHSTASDCWIIVSNNVYDVTAFIPSHPGGPDRIIGQCGKDATIPFQTQDGHGSHSAAARSELDSFKTGTLKLT